MTNVNETTGIRYGVIAAHNVPDLYETITTNGVSLSWESHLADARKQIAALLDELGASRAEQEAADIVSNLDWDGVQIDEEDYEYIDSAGNKFQLSHLGGAALIWCIQTSKVAHASRLCSPCVPNAADLDSGLVSADDGYECYAIPDEYAAQE